jgi:Tol biopolymer transport system component
VTVDREQQIRDLYEAALRQRATDRAAFVAARAGGDTELQRAVELLLVKGAATVGVADASVPALGAGTYIGQYRVEGLLGAGGMGVVYRATCTKLNRQAAIKFLSSHLADADARRRFQSEAQTASSLNHPHIVTVYDTGDYQDRQYLITEFVDGGTLRQWANEPRSWRQIVELLVGVADALATAHEAQIVHRDVKPENILVARNGYAKLADFGLAKLAGAGGSASGTSHPSHTKTGAVIGTIDYMSPEQASGRALDARSDVFSFGVVLYEMLTGRQPFGGASDYERLRAVVDGEPPPLPDDLPESLRMLVEKALEKDPAARYQSMREMVVDLRRLASRRQRAATGTAATVAPPERPRSRPVPWIAVVAVGATALVLALALWREQQPARLSDNPLAGAQFTRFTNFPGDETNAAISPDGKFVTFMSDRDGHTDYWLGQVGTERFQNLTMDGFPVSTRFIRSGGFNGDGSEIWLWGGVPSLVGSRMRLLPLITGEPRAFLGELAVNVDWSPDRTRIAYHTSYTGDPLFVADRDGANAKQLVIGQPETHEHFPTWSPDGRWIYFVRYIPNQTEGALWRIAATGGEPERLTPNSSYVGHPTPLDERTVLYIGEDENAAGPWLWVLDIDTKVTRRLSFGLERYTSLAVSADRRRLAATVVNPVASLWSVPILDHTATEADVRPYTVPSARALAPRFAGTALYYLSSFGGGDGLWRAENGQATEVWRSSQGALLEPAAISSDRQWVAVVIRRNGKQTLWVLNSDGSEPRSPTDMIDVRGAASWSPDGRWIAAGGIDADGPGLFKIPVAGGAPVRLRPDVGFNPVWSPDGELIVYTGTQIGGDSPLRAVTAEGDPVELPPIQTRIGGERVRFLPGGEGLLYMEGGFGAQDFWLLDLATKQSRRLTQLTNPQTMRTFDVTPDGKQIVFDRLPQNSDIVLIDLPPRP